MPDDFWTAARAAMLLDAGVANLNTGSFGPLPRVVFDRVTALRRGPAAWRPHGDRWGPRPRPAPAGPGVARLRLLRRQLSQVAAGADRLGLSVPGQRRRAAPAAVAGQLGLALRPGPRRRARR